MKKKLHRSIALLAMLMLLASCTSVKKISEPKPDPNSFAVWQLRHQTEIKNLERYLHERNLTEVLPTAQLLRSASSWQECHAEPFVMPPRTQWASMASVLKLLQQLKNTGVVGDVEVYSGYRTPTLNACAGGAVRSTHVNSFALDFRVLGSESRTEALCGFWRTQGKQWNMGFSVYPSGRIHIDTTRYRTWGSDYTGKTTVCSMFSEKLSG
ncbi:MAG: D-Ala-D-Ala carboxypeptidase family metallohydrolase [Pseudomonadales bacterium]